MPTTRPITRSLFVLSVALLSTSCANSHGHGFDALLTCDLAEGEVPVRLSVRINDDIGGACRTQDALVEVDGVLDTRPPTQLRFEWEGEQRVLRGDSITVPALGPDLRCDAMAGWLGLIEHGPCSDVVFSVASR